MSSIGRGGSTAHPFRKYLVFTKKFLKTEPASTRVSLSAIAVDSFGGTHEILKGMDAHAD